MKELFTIPAGEKVTEKMFIRTLVSSICSILVCMSCLAATTWAWFTVSIDNTDNVIHIGEPEVKLTVNDNDFSSGSELQAGENKIRIEHANELDDLQRKSTLYVTLTFNESSDTSSTYSTGGMTCVYVTLSHENQYTAEIIIDAEKSYTMGVIETWFEPDGADELTDSTIYLPAEPEPNILITSEEFLYGSYFDHDRFEGNTGTRLTSGAYGLIRSADALLPAQDITICVEDTDLSKYNVTLGYYTKDGIYTGRNGILPMIDGKLTIKASEMSGAYFRVNVYLYDGSFYKVPESAQIVVYGGDEAVKPEQPTEPSQPADPSQPTDPTQPTQPSQPDDSQGAWEGKKITILGDSISTGGYTSTLADMTGATLQNLSVSGTRLAGGLTGKVADVAEDADLVIVFGGTNDYWHKNVDIGPADSTDPGTYNGALRYILDYLKTNRPNAKYLFVFPPDQTFQGNPCTTDFGKGTLHDFRAAFLKFCQENDVPYVDLGETEFDPAKHSGDGVHPNSAGHQIIADAIYEAISSGL